MNNVHTQIEHWMAAAITNGLSTEEQCEFDAHLRDCAACRQLFTEEQMVSSMIQQAFADDQPSEDFDDRMVARFRRNLAEQKCAPQRALELLRRFWQFRLVRWAAAAA